MRLRFQTVISSTGRRRAAVALVATAALALSACGGSSADAAEDKSSPSEKAAKPGYGSCDFSTDGAKKLDLKAELQETDDAYKVTFTGGLLDPDKLLNADSAEGRVKLTVNLWDPKADQGSAVNLVTQWDAGKMVFTGASTNKAANKADTGAELKKGSYTATFPKDVDVIKKAPAPTTWTPDVYISDGTGDEDGITSAQCQDPDKGAIPYRPLD